MPFDLSKFSAQSLDRGATRLREVLWVAVKCTFFLPPWPVPSALRCFMLRCFGARIGRGVVIRSRVNIWFPWRLRIDDYAWIGEEVFVLNLAPVIIERGVCVSQRVFLCTGSHDYRLIDFPLVTKPITLRAASWVAAQSFVAPGVEIGSGAVVGAGSVVLQDVPPETLVRGNPAQIVRNLHEDESKCPG